MTITFSSSSSSSSSSRPKWPNTIKAIICFILGFQLISWFYEFYTLQTTQSNLIKSNLTPKRIKVALCLSGQLRTFEECYMSIKSNVLNVFDCDVFMCFGSDETDSNIDRALKLYSPKDYVVSEWKYENSMKYKNGIDNKGLAYMARKMWEVDGLRRSYEQKVRSTPYDMVIRCRYDLFLYEKVPCKQLDSVFCSPSSDVVGVPKIPKDFAWLMPNSTANIYPFDNGVTDQLFFANSTTMTKLVNAFYYEGALSDAYSNTLLYNMISPEKILYDIVDARFVLKTVPYKWVILRHSVILNSLNVYQFVLSLYLQVKKIIKANV